MTALASILTFRKSPITCDDCGGLWVRDEDGVFRANHGRDHLLHTRNLQDYHFCTNEDKFLSEEGRELLYKVDTRAWRKKQLLRSLPTSVTLAKRQKIGNDFDSYADELKKQLEAARVEARRGGILFYDVELKRLYCPSCGEGLLNVGLRTCYVCDGRYHHTQMEELEIFDSPFDAVGTDIHVCTEVREGSDHTCRSYLTSSGWGDFHYQKCSCCERIICVRNPKNGYHTHFRDADEAFGQICLDCYQNNILVNGVDKEQLKQGKLPGMFFRGDNRELHDAGFYRVKDSVFINSEASAKSLADDALERMKSGHIVVLSYERMSTFGGEGYVSMWVRIPESKEQTAQSSSSSASSTTG